LRVLFTCLPGYGHFNQLVPLARTFDRRGDVVAFATASEFGERVEAAGFLAFPAGLGMAAQMEAARVAYPEQHGLPPGKARFEAFVPRMLAGVAAPARAADLVPLAQWWRPDLIVHDEAELAAPLAARLAGAVWASHSVVLRRPLTMARLSGQMLAPLYRSFGLEPDRLAGLYRYAHLDSCPAGLQLGGAPAPEVNWPIRSLDGLDTVPGEVLPDWIHDLPAGPTVYVTLGTVFNRNREALARLLRGVAALDVNVIATVGADNTAALPPQPAHVRLEAYLPLSLVLPHVDVVVTQGGTSILPALAAGRPLLVAPQGADQFHNADACVASGAALRLLPAELTASTVAAQVRRLLSDSAFSDAARRIRAEMATMPGPDMAAAMLTRVATQREPVRW
jgi:UDP:flavonoid glycosyltransferase YjiC (YdhE family)